MSAEAFVGRVRNVEVAPEDVKIETPLPAECCMRCMCSVCREFPSNAVRGSLTDRLALLDEMFAVGRSRTEWLSLENRNLPLATVGYDYATLVVAEWKRCVSSVCHEAPQ